ncbi:hypothetical protein ACFPIJ_00415 [Dactylosporangium cerinum]|uniref:Uncharacterized protein n=1 Tax=Dactylosporangium cerinum TaxID=1434730 RepID=A0ABV9VL65_9ACTN
MLFRYSVAPLGWRLPKPVTRAAWAAWADDDSNLRQEMLRDAQWQARARGAPSTLVTLPSGDPTVPGYDTPDMDAQPEGSTERARRRRMLADRVYAEMLATPLGRGYRGSALLMSTSLPSSVEEAPGALTALRKTPAVVANARRGEVRSDSGPGGLLMRVHGPTWSLVFRLTPYLRPVLVFVDEVPEFCWQVDDDADARDLITDMVNGVIRALSRYDIRGGDKYPDRLRLT